MRGETKPNARHTLLRWTRQRDVSASWRLNAYVPLRYVRSARTNSLFQNASNNAIEQSDIRCDELQSQLTKAATRLEEETVQHLNIQRSLEDAVAGLQDEKRDLERAYYYPSHRHSLTGVVVDIAQLRQAPTQERGIPSSGVVSKSACDTEIVESIDLRTYIRFCGALYLFAY